MMPWLIWTVRIIVFIFLLALALMNSSIVQISFFFGLHWEMPLALLLLIVLSFGITLGVLTMLGKIWRLSREVARLKRNEPDD